ncbi:MAG TPA: ABC transporter ATP-binding protein [Clostridiales bacterium]|jgi:ATP-binding cassette subfamily B protein|nr:ABC transporter ATP-binding protein [Clostridiales bacterium]
MQLFRKLIKYYKPHMKLFYIDMACAFLVAVSDLFYPYIVKDIINDFIPNKNLRMLIVWAVVLLLIYIVKAFMNFVVQYWGHVMGVRIQGDMRKDMFTHLQRLPFSYFDENKTGTIMSRLINDLMDISELAHHGPENLFLSSIMLIGAFVMLMTINIPLALIVFALVPIMTWYAVATRSEMNSAFSQSRKEIAEVNANIETAISGVRVSRSYTSESHETAKFEKANEHFKKARGRAYRAMGKFFSGMTFFNDLLYLVVLIAGGLFVYYDKINVGEFAAFLLYVTMFLKPVNRLVNLFEQMQDGMTGLQRFNEIMEQEPETDSENAVSPKDIKGHIRFENVSFKYKNSDATEEESKVISNLTIDIPPGKTVALVGPSGAGKTTLCHLIPRFYEPTEGRILIDGIDVKDFSRLALRKNIGLVAQDVFLFNGTIKENIAYGNLDASDDEIIEAAKKANIHDYIMTLEHGYDSQVGERGVKLSGGQKQRISIARVFLKNPAILILDEATSSLDNATEMQIQEELSELAKNRTTIVVAHRLSTVKNADEIIVLTKDGVEERGTHEELIAKNGLYTMLYNFQFKE